MGGIEILAATVVFIVGAIGLIRGPAKELGVTMALIVILAVLAQFDTLVEFQEMPGKVNNIVASFGLDTDDPQRQSMLVLFLYSAAIIVTAFLAYHGQDTLKFSFKDPPGAGGAILGWLVGAFNGYLIFGTIWYYMNQLNYPIQRYAWFTPTFTDLARNLINMLPQSIAGGVVMSGLALALLWWRILR
jgi:uncharacterized membrane protein required for colicin V production